MFTANTYTVFIASPNDVIEERDAAQYIINRWNGINSDSKNITLLPLRWENNVAPGLEKDGQSIINEKLLDRTDLLVAIFGIRIGSPTKRNKSATIEEIEYHIKQNKPAMIFFFKGEPKEGYDIEQYEEVQKLKAEYYSKGLVKEFETLENFKSVFYDCLQLKLNENKNIFSSYNIENDNPKTVKFDDLSEEAKIILIKMNKALDGTIIVTSSKSGFNIQCGNNLLFQGENIKEKIKWQDALAELELNNQIQKKSSTHYTITSKGLKSIDTYKPELLISPQDKNKPRLALALQWTHGFRLNNGLSLLNDFSKQPIDGRTALWFFEISNKYNLILKNVSKEPAWNIRIENPDEIFDIIQKLPPLASLNSSETIFLEVEFLQYHHGYGKDADKLPRIPIEKDGKKIKIQFEDSTQKKINSTFILQDGIFIEE